VLNAGIRSVIVHPNDAGYRVMADAIPIGLL